jgi:chromosome segregation ATPase
MSHKITESKAEMERAQSSSEEAKKQLDTRMKEEVDRHQESISKVESKLSYYRHQLDNLRDDWGKKEIALNSQVQDLQGAVARSTVTHDTQFSQIRSQDDELRRYRGEITNQSRSMTQSTSQALASTNRLKRLEDELQQREFDIKELKKRTIVDKSDTVRREADLRTLLKSRDGENFEVNNKLNELQRTLIAREEEIRRLTAKL